MSTIDAKALQTVGRIAHLAEALQNAADEIHAQTEGHGDRDNLTTCVETLPLALGLAMQGMTELSTSTVGMMRDLERFA